MPELNWLTKEEREELKTHLMRMDIARDIADEDNEHRQTLREKEIESLTREIDDMLELVELKQSNLEKMIQRL